jgi:hypothetical protein
MLRLPAHIDRARVEVDVIPDAVHCLLFAQTGHEQEFVKKRKAISVFDKPQDRQGPTNFHHNKTKSEEDNPVTI